MREASFYTRLDHAVVRCGLCRFSCQISPGQRGRCLVRENRDGTLYSLVYGLTIAEHVDPIEKKPLYHVLPGSRSYSVATVGCNFRCRHCQNYAISQPVEGTLPIRGHERTPAELVQAALANECQSIAYTYTEPTVYFEYAYDTAVLAKQAGLKNIFVSNGYISPEPLAALAPYLAAANIDLKGFSRTFYREVVGADLEQVLATIRDYHQQGIWLEITTLLIPGLNDDPAELRALASFIANELGVDTPWHLSAFFPTYQLLQPPPTPVKTLHLARDIGRSAGLQYIYLGNVRDASAGQTSCPGCANVVIDRSGYAVSSIAVSTGTCPTCSARIPGVWQ